MPAIRLVHLLTVGSAFQARVVSARLGSEGILTELRGALGGPYPFGDVVVYVDADDLALARQLLLADEVESAFDVLPSSGPAASGHRARMAMWVVAGGMLVVATASTLTHVVGA